MSQPASNTSVEFRAERKGISWLAMSGVIAFFGVFAAVCFTVGGYVGTSLGGLLVLAIGYIVYVCVVDPKRFLVLTTEGLHDPVVVPGGIRWNEIDRFELLEQTGSKGYAMLLDLHLRAPTFAKHTISLTDYRLPWREVLDEIRVRIERAQACGLQPPEHSQLVPPALVASYSRGMAWMGLAASVIIGLLFALPGGLLIVVGGCIAAVGIALSLWRLSQTDPQIVLDAAGVRHRHGHVAWRDIEDVVLETRQRGAAREFYYAELTCRGGQKLRLDLNDLDVGPQLLIDELRRGVAFGRQAPPL